MTVIDEIATERRRQIEAEGYDSVHDDGHPGEMARAAACYAWAAGTPGRVFEPERWPWGRSAYKPKDRRRDLIRAAALIVAEIERIDRAKGE